ncbi:MAG: alpha/beta hydrolase [Saprospiraceae bacterium]
MEKYPTINGSRWMLLLIALACACSKTDPSAPPKGFLNESTLKLAYATGALKLIETEPAIPETLLAFKDITYKETIEKNLKVDIYHHRDIQQPTPLLVFIHGGSWKKGDKDDYRRYLVDYAEKGYVTATISYRFSQEAPFPAALDDVTCAIKWLKQHASEYHIDPQKIAVIGGSAGGHLGMMLAYHASDSTYSQPVGCETGVDSKIQALVNLYGPTDLTTPYSVAHPSVIALIGSEYSDTTKTKFEAASPLFFISPDDPPTLIFHGTIDDLVPVSQSDTLQMALTRANVPVYYHRLEGWPHTMDLSLKVNNYCQVQMDAFFAKYLK